MKDDKLTIRPDGTLIHSVRTSMVDMRLAERILVQWSDIYHQIELSSDQPCLRFFVPDRNNKYEGRMFQYHRSNKPAKYEYINGNLFSLYWFVDGHTTKSMRITDGFCKIEDIRDYSLFIDRVTSLLKQNPHMKNWTKWTNRERALFKLKCL